MSTKHLIVAASTLLASITAVGCSAGSPNVSESAGAETSKPQPKVALIQTMDEFKAMDATKLSTLFNSPDAVNAMVGAKPLNGDYDGIPLCRKDALPTDDQLPPRVADITGADTIVKLLGLSEKQDNKLATALWHGKRFYPTLRPADANLGLTENDRSNACEYSDQTMCGGVQNFIDDPLHPEIKGRLAATAVDFFDIRNKFLVLNYAAAKDGVPGAIVDAISTELITHVYDTVRLVNSEKQIYLGMAWLVDVPGVYERENTDPTDIENAHKNYKGRPLTVPSCYFALQLRPGTQR